VLLLALGQPLVRLTEGVLHTQSFNLCPHSCGKDANHRDATGTIRHRFVVDHRDVAEHPTLLIEQRHAAITLRAPLSQQMIELASAEG
jgi:hypothetical protein